MPRIYRAIAAFLDARGWTDAADECRYRARRAHQRRMRGYPFDD